MKVYLDIDGVLLHKGGRLPAGLGEFIAFVTDQFDCYWLTTHCKGDSSTALRYLAGYMSADLLAKLAKVKPTQWDALKTEGIDLAAPFVWLDDQPFGAEKEVLSQAGMIDGLIIVDLRLENELLRIRDLLANHLLNA